MGVLLRASSCKVVAAVTAFKCKRDDGKVFIFKDASQQIFIHLIYLLKCANFSLFDCIVYPVIQLSCPSDILCVK